jgi:integrase
LTGVGQWWEDWVVTHKTPRQRSNAPGPDTEVELHVGSDSRPSHVPPGHRGRHTHPRFRVSGAGGRQQTVLRLRPWARPVLLDSRTQKEARAEWDELRGKAANGQPPPKRNVRLRDIQPVWWERKRRNIRTGTADNYEEAWDLVLSPYLGHRRLTEISADVISRLQLGLRDRGLNYVDPKRPVRPLSVSRVQNLVKPLQGMMKLAAKRHGVPNPFLLLDSDDRPKADDDDEGTFVYEWSDAEINRVVAKADERDRRPGARMEYAQLIRFAIETGARLGEITGADWQDLDLDEGVFTVRQQWTKKGELAPVKTKAGRRRIPLTPEFCRYMKAYKLRSRFSQDDDPVFSAMGRGGSKNGGGSRLRHRNVQRRAWEPVQEALGLPDKVTFHQLRHCFASRAAWNGVRPEMLATVMGHSTTKILEIYVHLFNREQTEDEFRRAMASQAS